MGISSLLHLLLALLGELLRSLLFPRNWICMGISSLRLLLLLLGALDLLVGHLDLLQAVGLGLHSSNALDAPNFLQEIGLRLKVCSLPLSESLCGELRDNFEV